MLQQWWARFTRWFFGNFFYLLFLTITATQWVLLCWLWLYPWIDSLWLHLIGLTGVHQLNRHMAGTTQRFGRGLANRPLLSRVYFGFAFGSFFCAVYLLLVAGAWAASAAVVGSFGSNAADAVVARGFTLIANLGIAAIALAFLYGYTIGQIRLKVRRIPIPVRRLPSALEGLRIAQISDIHIGHNMTRSELAAFVSRVNELKPDLICITGDIADGPASDVDDAFPVLAQLKATHGVLAILGNHDHYCGANRVIEALQRHTSFQVLRDRACAIPIGEAMLHVIGLDDRGRDWARGVSETPELTRLLATVPANQPVLLLSHRPDIFQQAAGAGIALTLSGHTHGGQLALPRWRGRPLNPARLTTPFDRGLFERDGSYLYVNCGLGVTGQRIRLATPREISVFELRRCPTAPAS